MRSWSAWIAAWTFFSFRSLRNFTMARLASVGMPCCSVTTRRTVSPPPRSISPSVRFFTGTWRFTIRPCTISHSACHLELVVGDERNRAVGLVELDVGLRALEVVALDDFLAGLVEGVVDFLQVDGGGHIERTRAGHLSLSLLPSRQHDFDAALRAHQPGPDERAGRQTAAAPRREHLQHAPALEPCP